MKKELKKSPLILDSPWYYDLALIKENIRAEIHVENELREVQELIQYSTVSERIILNAIISFLVSVGKIPVKIYSEENPLRLLIVFDEISNSEQEDKIYDAITRTEDMAIAHEDRTFSWHITNSKNLHCELVEGEYETTYEISLNEKNRYKVISVKKLSRVS